jgi:cation:H+ antiporter
MEIALQILLVVVGLAVAIVASDVAVGYTRALASALGAPAFIVGVTLVSLGTDLPEIANSITAHIQGKGDVNVGDSVGSTLTQYTLVLGFFPLIAGALVIERLQVTMVSVMTVLGLALTALFVSNGWLGRAEGVALVGAWALLTLIIVRTGRLTAAEDPPEVRHQGKLKQAGIVVLTLGLVGIGATVAVRALIRLAELAGVPEFMLAFFGVSIGTSAPEMVVDFTALTKGAPAIALGDALGSSFVDATLSIGAGPVVAPAEVTPRLAVSGSLYTLVAIALVGALLAKRRIHDRWSAAALLGLYALSYPLLIERA